MGNDFCLCLLSENQMNQNLSLRDLHSSWLIWNLLKTPLCVCPKIFCCVYYGRPKASLLSSGNYLALHQFKSRYLVYLPKKSVWLNIFWWRLSHYLQKRVLPLPNVNWCFSLATILLKLWFTENFFSILLIYPASLGVTKSKFINIMER